MPPRRSPRVSSSGAREPLRKGRLPSLRVARGLDRGYTATAWYGVRRGEQDHPAMFTVQVATYAAGANPFGKEVPHHMIKNFISTLLARFQSEDEEGQTLVEYGLLLALIAIIIIVALIFLGPIISQMFRNVGTTLNAV